MDGVADLVHCSIHRVSYHRIHPCVRNVWLHFALEKGPDVFLKPYLFDIAKARVGFRGAVCASANLGGFVSFGKFCEQYLDQALCQANTATRRFAPKECWPSACKECGASG